jgi:hypothetical protein
MLPRQVHFAHHRIPILRTPGRLIRFGPQWGSRKKRDENDDGEKRAHPLLQATGMPLVAWEREI